MLIASPTRQHKPNQTKPNEKQIMHTYTVSAVSLDDQGYKVVNLINSIGCNGGIITNDPSMDYYVKNADLLKVGDSIDI